MKNELKIDMGDYKDQIEKMQTQLQNMTYNTDDNPLEDDTPFGEDDINNN